MRRSRQSRDDSLELLLDTICNVFGGIVFIAILVSLLTSAQTTTVRELQNEQIEQVSNIQLVLEGERIQSQIQSVRAGLVQLQQSRDMFDNDRTRQAIESINSVRKANQQVDHQITILENWIDQANGVDTDDVDKTESLRDDAQAQLQDLQAAVKELETQNRIEGRMPQTRVTRKTQVIFWIRGGRVYWIPTIIARRVLGNQREGDVNVKEHRLAEIFMPNDPGGFVFDIDAEVVVELQRILTAMVSRRDFFELFVADDSVAEFQRFKEIIAKEGFDYNVTPVNSDEPLILGRTNTVHTQ